MIGCGACIIRVCFVLVSLCVFVLASGLCLSPAHALRHALPKPPNPSPNRT